MFTGHAGTTQELEFAPESQLQKRRERAGNNKGCNTGLNLLSRFYNPSRIFAEELLQVQRHLLLEFRDAGDFLLPGPVVPHTFPLMGLAQTGEMGGVCWLAD